MRDKLLSHHVLLHGTFGSSLSHGNTGPELMDSISTGDLDGCSSLLEYACICRSAAYQSSVAVSPPYARRRTLVRCFRVTNQ
jgi:hypothetical protein